MANKVAVLTDSTAYLPKEWVDKHNISVVPLLVVWGEEELYDNVDIGANEFFNRLPSAKVMPSTSQPTPNAFKEIFEKLAGQGYDILCVHISSKFSGTINSAEQAAKMVPEANIEIVDSLCTIMGTGWPALFAARAAEKGADLATCKQIAETAREHIYTLFAVDTLEFLHRGGRIGGAAALLGTALNLKPILYVKDGAIESLEKVRTRKKSLSRLVELAVEQIGVKRPVYMGVSHANAEEEAKQVLAMLEEQVEIKESVLTYVSPVIGTHTGPGTVALSFMYGYDI